MEDQLNRVLSGERDETTVESALSYAGEGPVQVRVRLRDQRYDLDDGGGAVRLAGKPDGWLETGQRLMVVHGMSIDDDGLVFTHGVDGRNLPSMVLSVADTSLALHRALLEGEHETVLAPDMEVE